MIVSYRDKRAREFAAGKRVKAFSGFARFAQLRLDRLDAAVSVKDLAALPGNRFETLSGPPENKKAMRAGQAANFELLKRVCETNPA